MMEEDMHLNTFMRQVHSTAREKGWHDSERRPLEIHALISSEIGEATEAVRGGLPHFFLDGKGKPEGEAVELADAVIRIADYFGKNGWNFAEILKAKMEYNKTRSYRHGGKKV